MSTKFEQLLDYLVNEEHDKANELFHEIVVEKSREIYESLLAEEAEDDEQQDESVESEEEQQDESVESEEEQQDEGFMPDEEFEEADDDQSDSEPDDSEDGPMVPQDQGDDLEFDTSSSDDVQQQLADIVGELQAVLDQMDGEGQGPDEFDSDETSLPVDGEEGDDDLQMGVYEGKKRMTREYVEKVGSDWEKGSTQKSQGQYAGAGTGDKESAPVEGKSPIASGKNKPGPANVNASNILGDMKTGEGTNTGTKPAGKASGLVKPAQDMNTGNQNVPGGKVSVKGLTKVAGGHGPEKKGAGPGPVGAGTGDKAGQTSIAPETKKQFLKPYSK
jgi:hypothetical protein